HTPSGHRLRRFRWRVAREGQLHPPPPVPWSRTLGKASTPMVTEPREWWPRAQAIVRRRGSSTGKGLLRRRNTPAGVLLRCHPTEVTAWPKRRIRGTEACLWHHPMMMGACSRHRRTAAEASPRDRSTVATERLQSQPTEVEACPRDRRRTEAEACRRRPTETAEGSRSRVRGRPTEAMERLRYRRTEAEACPQPPMEAEAC